MNSHPKDCTCIPCWSPARTVPKKGVRTPKSLRQRVAEEKQSGIIRDFFKSALPD